MPGMSVTSTTRKAGPFSGDGVNATFPFTFKVFQASDVLVVQTDPSGNETTQTLTSQYTVTLNANQDGNPGGSVTMLTAPPIGYLTTLGSQVPQTQPTVLTNTGGFYPTVINDMLDRATILIQQASEKLGRALTLPFSASAGVSAQLPGPVAGNLLGWDALAQKIVNYAGFASAPVTAFMAVVLTAASAITARGLLGIGTDGTFSFRNRLHNGNFRINQRAVSGTVTLAAGQYGFDRWKAGAGGCTFTFAVNGNDVVVTITAGSLMQVVVGVNVEGGTYSLANRGTALARIAVNGAATSGAYAAASPTSSLQSATATASQAITVELSTGTLDRVQLEAGTVATTFERRPSSVELAMCQHYLWRVSAGGFAYMPIAPLQTISATTFQGLMQIPVPMWTTPIISLTSGGGSFNVWNSSGVAIAVSTVNPSASPFGISISGTVPSGLTAGGSTYLLGDAAGTAVVQASAEP